MASVVVSILKKRGNRGSTHEEVPNAFSQRSDENEDDIRFLQSTRTGRFMWWHQSPFSGSVRKFSTAEEIAAQAVQRMWRGYQIRQHMKPLLAENSVSWTSVTEALETLARWHIGWSRFLIHLIVMGLYIVTIYFQVYYEKPTAFDVNDAILARLRNPSSDLPPVHRPRDVADYLKALVNDFYHQTIVNSSVCSELLDEFCSLSSQTNDSDLESALAANCTTSEPGTAGYVYIDHVNQLLGASYVTQTRRMEKPCLKRFTRLDINGDNSQKNRACLDSTEEAREFVSDLCPGRGSSNGETLGDTSSCEAIYNGTQEEFVFNEREDAFIFALHVGFAFSLPLQAIQCKIDRMHHMGWLDGRSKRICIKFGFLNRNEQGRIALYEECYHFNLGGSVSRHVKVASTSLFTESVVPNALTWAAIVLVLVKLILDLMLFIKEWRARKKLRYRRPFLTLSGLLGLIPSLLLLAQSILFLIMVYSIQKAETDAQYATSNLVTNLTQNGTAEEVEPIIDAVLFLDALTDADWAVNLWIIFVTIVAISLVIMLGRAIDLLGFHPTSAIITGTLSKASSHLGCFFIIFVMVVLMYAYVGMILLGRTRPEFASLGYAINNLLFITVGELEKAYDFIFIDSPNDAFVMVIQALYFWSYVLLCTILLMNVLLSIIVGAFVDIQEKAEKHAVHRPILGFLRSLLTSLAFMAEGFLVMVCKLCPYSSMRTKCVKRSCECTSLRRMCVRRCGATCFRREVSAIRTESILQAAASSSSPSFKKDAKSASGDEDGSKRSLFQGHNDESMDVEKNPASFVSSAATPMTAKDIAEEASMLQLTPWERLIRFNRFKPSTGYIETRILRKKLHFVFRSETTVEHIIGWCRAKTRMERMEKFSVHLKGLDPDSALLKGHELYLLESILKRVAPASGRFEQTSGGSSRSLTTVNSDNNKSPSNHKPHPVASETEKASGNSTPITKQASDERLADVESDPTTSVPTEKDDRQDDDDDDDDDDKRVL